MFNSDIDLNNIDPDTVIGRGAIFTCVKCGAQAPSVIFEDSTPPLPEGWCTLEQRDINGQQGYLCRTCFAENMKLRCLTANNVAVYVTRTYYDTGKCAKLTSNVYIYTFVTGAIVFCSFEPITTLDAVTIDNYVAEHQLIKCDTDLKDSLQLWKGSNG